MRLNNKKIFSNQAGPSKNSRDFVITKKQTDRKITEIYRCCIDFDMIQPYYFSYSKFDAMFRI